MGQKSIVKAIGPELGLMMGFWKIKSVMDFDGHFEIGKDMVSFWRLKQRMEIMNQPYWDKHGWDEPTIADLSMDHVGFNQP